MTATFTTEDEMEARRWLKSLDMACFIHSIVCNDLKDAPEWVLEKIGEKLAYYNIELDELIE
jgi:hypothetical protein